MKRITTTVTIFTIAALLAGCAATGSARWTYAPAASARPAAPSPAPSAAPATSAAPSPAADPAGPSQVIGQIELHSFDLGFQPSSLSVAAAGRYEVMLHNDGAIAHDVTFPDGTSIRAEAGQQASGAVDVPASGLSFLCSIPGHADAGMKGEIVVSGVAQASPAATMNPDDHGGPMPGSSVPADPNAPPPVTHDPTAPDLLPGETHDIDLVITERDMTVAPGFVQHIWTFGDTVPGPVIRVKVGDLVRVHLINPATNMMAHSIDFHASMVAWNDEMRSIAPGEELLYEFTANHAGVWMYHCGTTPALHHIANGMYGLLIVEPREGLPPVDQEFTIVQSEWYLGPQGQPVSLEKASAAAPAPDFVVFNGVANQYKDAPIEVLTGERVRVFVLNAGPNIDSSFHIVGTIFDRVTREGVTMDASTNGGWASQAVDLAPAQAAIVEFTLAEDGLYPMVTHAFNFVGLGGLGLFQAGDGDPTN